MLIKAPAKINVGLRILSKREDGFHNLETIFYPIRLFDHLEITVERTKAGTNSIIIKSEKHSAPLNKNNTCFKAVQSFFKIFNIREFYRIDIILKKKIPIGGGLGGGSSDAAAVIRYLVRFFDLNVNDVKQKLISCALEVGSDVPFFLVQKPCYATGKGEKLRLLNNFILDYDILLVNPNIHVSTKTAYESLGISPGYVSEPVLSSISSFDPDRKELFVNEFEDVVFRKYPVLKSVKETLYAKGAVFASMTGSGAVVYGLFRRSDREKFNEAFNDFLKSGYFTAIA